MSFICNKIIYLLLLLLTLWSINCSSGAFASSKYNISKSDNFYMDADHVTYDSIKDYVIAKGNVRVIMSDYYVRANYLYYDVGKDILYASGNVYIKDNENKVIVGDRALLKDKIKRGVIQEFALKFDDSNIVASKLAKRIDEQKMALYHSSFTPCDTCQGVPIWQIKSKETNINLDEHRIYYSHVFFEIYGVPLVYIPFFSHPTPSAPAKSGILVPKIENNKLVIPLYYRARSDLDFTLSPKVTGSNKILELEARHKKRHGDLKTKISYSRDPHRVPNKAKPSKNRYFITANGDFVQNNINYGFGANRISDKAFLKNYYERYDAYLKSNIYVNYVDHSDYFDMQVMHFQDLRGEGVRDDVPLIFPAITARKIFPLDDDETLQFAVKNNTLFYNNLNGNQLVRAAFDFDLSKHIISDFGYIMDIGISNRSDIYLLNYQDESRRKNANGDPLPTNTEDARYRNIPELYTKISVPFTKALTARTDIIIEPIISSTIGKNYHHKYNKFVLIDISKFELTENNIFNSNRFSGIDYHEYGQRLNYGIQGSILSNILYQRIFFGQAIYGNNVVEHNNQEYVGNYSLDLLNGFDAFYRFRKTKHFHAIRDELGVNVKINKLQFESSFTSINNVSRFFANNDIKVPGNKMKQFFFGWDYQLTDNITIGNDNRFNIKGSKFSALQRTIRVTYVKDCVSISAKIYNDFTSDANRGIKKINAPTIEIGLKTINI